MRYVVSPAIAEAASTTGDATLTYPLTVGGTVLVYAASVSFEEILDARVTSEERRGG
jgi:hypothetical protein